MHLGWPTKTYLVDHAHRFIYCPIPKVACSSILHWCLAVSGETAMAAGRNVHEYVRQRRSLRAGGWRAARVALRDASYFKFTFVRHPFPRLVSAYANKFLRVRSPAWPTIRAIQAHQDGLNTGIARRWLRRWSAAWRRDLTAAEAERGVTFRQFVEYVVTQSPHSLDVHWRPQHLFLGTQPFDFVGRFERLETDFASVQQVLGLDLPLSVANRSSYGDAAGDHDTVADWEASRLRGLPALPPWQKFYTPDLEKLVTRAYADDFEQFGYDPHWSGTDGADAATVPAVQPRGSSRRAA